MDSLTDRLRRTIAQRGVRGTLPMCWGQFLRMITPTARLRDAQRRKVDALFDGCNNVETGGIVRPRQESVIGQNWIFGINYQAVDPDSFVAALNELRISYPEFTFVDFGSGKGRALLLASEFPFKKIIGIEYCQDLNLVARRNLLRYPASGRRCEQIEILEIDATDFAIPDNPVVLFFFNSFGRAVMEAVVRNVTDSFQRHPRRMVVVYFTPYFADLWEEARLFTRVQSSPALFDTSVV
jgi:hypothetical protein